MWYLLQGFYQNSICCLIAFPKGIHGMVGVGRDLSRQPSPRRARCINVRGVCPAALLVTIECVLGSSQDAADLAGLNGLQGLVKWCEWSSQLQGEVKVLARAVRMCKYTW